MKQPDLKLCADSLKLAMYAEYLLDVEANIDLGEPKGHNIMTINPQWHCSCRLIYGVFTYIGILTETILLPCALEDSRSTKNTERKRAKWK